MTSAATGQPAYGGGAPQPSAAAPAAGGGLEGSMAGFKALAPPSSAAAPAPTAPSSGAGAQKAPFDYNSWKPQQGLSRT
jgi:hypothetical protein